ncbi:MAG: FAD-dependent monooxygenase, partial [Caulobacteraceae bacterium]
MHVLLAGAGLGGLTAALCLRRRGADVTVLEQAAVLGEAGAGVQLSPNATRILIDLGLGPAIEAVACEPASIEMREGRGGRLLMHLPLEQARGRWGGPYLHLHRADLQQALLDALSAEGGADIRLSARVEAVEAAQVRLADGETLAADAVIGCDGIRSAVRTALLGEAPPRFTGQVAWRGLVPAERLPPELSRPAARAWLGVGRHFVCYPVKGGMLINFIGVVERPDWRV